MSRTARRWLGLLLSLSVVLVGSALAERSALLSDLHDAQDAGIALDGRLDDAIDAASAWEETLAARSASSALFARLLDARTVFVSSLSGARTAFTAASGKVDASSHLATVRKLQEAVLAERSDPAVVAAAAASVDAATSAVTAAVAAYDAEQQRLAAERVAASRGSAGGSVATVGPRMPSSGSVYDRVRAALDRVGGASVPLEEYGGACGSVSAAACAYPSGVIRFTPGLASWSNARLHWVMAHELAHIHQFRIWGAMTSSAGYGSLFRNDPELLANCMAQQRGYPSGNVWCSGEQLEWGAAIWRGSVPG